MKPPPCVIDRWAGGRLTQDRKVPSLSPGHGNLANKGALQSQGKFELKLSTDKIECIILCIVYRLGSICFRSNEITKAITCFEYSLHMRNLLYGKDGIHLKIVQSLVYLGSAWAEYGNYHR